MYILYGLSLSVSQFVSQELQWGSYATLRELACHHLTPNLDITVVSQKGRRLYSLLQYSDIRARCFLVSQASNWIDPLPSFLE